MVARMNVAILGLSNNPTRYAFRAARQLHQAGHAVWGIHPERPAVPDATMVGSIDELPADIHTLTIYLAEARSEPLADAIAGYGFARAIFNPGAENHALMEKLAGAGVETVEGCTLVMLRTSTF